MTLHEVIKENYSDNLTTIKDSINKAAFISIDTEFTGLNLTKGTKSSLFDSAEERYQKAKKNVKQFTISQFGLTAFVSVGPNRYEAHTYNCYLFPVSSANYDCRFTMQASSVQFLCQFGFDFNKMMYHGIPYLNDEQEILIRKYLTANIGRSDDLDLIHKDLLRMHCSKVARWLVQAREGDIYTVDKSGDSGEIPNNILHDKLVHRIDNIWPRPSREDVLIVEKVSKERREELMRDHPIGGKDQERFIEHAVGFTHIIRHLCNSKKALVGHNLYLDLMLMYDKFINHLPGTYQEYKHKLHEKLPNIYDTKYMSLQNRRVLEGTLYSYDSTNLSELYHSMIDREKCAGLLYPPAVSSGYDLDKSKSLDGGDTEAENKQTAGQIHEAGFDSYMCGYVFLRLAHLIAIHNDPIVAIRHPIPFYDYGVHIQPYNNKVNLIRATLHNICLDAPDPPSARPDQLFVTSKHSPQLNTDEVSLLLSSFGSVDINQISSNKAIVAVSNFTCARRILSEFRSHDRYSVVKYSTLRHSPKIRKLLWVGLAVTAGICAMTYIRVYRKR